MTPFNEIGRLPTPGDNVAIATRNLPAGTSIKMGRQQFALSHTVLEGHRFAIQKITKGSRLTSWGMPFGTALEHIDQGAYVSNAGVLEALRGRSIDFELPERPNFTDDIPTFEFDADSFEPASQIEPAEEELYFEGYARSGGRGIGTRNFIAVVGMSSRTAGFVRRLVNETSAMTGALKHVDGIVPVAHTEGEDTVQLNKDLVLRTLAGFVVHPNIGAVLIVDHASASIKGADLKAYLVAQEYAIEDVHHQYLTLHGAYAMHLEEGKTVIQNWLPVVNQMERSLHPLANLKIALQCGGSDAFSGISGNPLAGWVAKAVIAQGGGANLAETDELIGAESYILKKVRSEKVVRKFLHFIDRFQERAHRHGSSAAGNPSGGNKFRGLYNIYLKSLGAAMKRHPDVRLDHVIAYGEPMKSPGYYFMDSPGNDLESIAGQVASGCNMIFFVTGNGSITNFPFVPTIKVVTTSQRFALLSEDMDVNAGAYLDGTSMDTLGQQLLAHTIDVASGQQSVGEIAGHAQVQLWRNWRLKAGDTLGSDPGDREYDGIPVPIAPSVIDDPIISIERTANKKKGVGLVLPTSLCSGQISNMAVERLNASGIADEIGIDSFVTLIHTEGCGASSGASEHLFLRTMCGYLSHPDVTLALLLEHGCEKTHNDYFRNYLEQDDVDTTRYGWASIQQDGGIEQVLDKIEGWFEGQSKKASVVEVHQAEGLSVGLILPEKPSPSMVQTLAKLVRWLSGNEGTLVLPSISGLDTHAALVEQIGIPKNQQPTLNCAQRFIKSGFHLMASPSLHVQELLASMGATGVEVLVVVSNEAAMPAHPFIPTVQIGDPGGENLDWVLPEADLAVNSLLNLLYAARNGFYASKNEAVGNYDFQVSRGWKGISL